MSLHDLGYLSKQLKLKEYQNQKGLIGKVKKKSLK